MSFTEDLKSGTNPYRMRFKEIIDFLILYFKNPVDGIQKLPNWDWQTLIVFYLSIAAICGALSGIFVMRLGSIFVGLLVFPISTLIILSLVSGFFYYTFNLIFHRQVQYKLIFTVNAFSLLPFFALYTLSGFIDAVKLVGLAVSSVLLTVGLSTYTHVDRKKIIKLVGSLYLLYFLFWIYSVLSWQHENDRFKNVATPETYEKLKEEFSD